MICFTSFPLCRLLVNSRTRSRSFFVAFGLGHRCMKCHAGVSLDTPLLANRASQEYEALLPAPQVHQPRLRRMQRQSEPVHHQPDPPKRFPRLPIPCGTSPRNHRHIGPVSQAGYIAPPRSDPTCSGRCWPATARSLRPAGSPPAFPSPSRPPSLRLPTIGGSTSAPFDPRSAPSPTPSGCPSGCCQSSLECLHRRRSSCPWLPATRIASRACCRALLRTESITARLGNPPRKSARSPTSPPSAPLDPAPSVSPMAAASHLLSVCIAASPVKDDIGLPATLLRSPPETPPRPRCSMAWIVSASTPAAPPLLRTRLHASHRTSLL